MNAGAPNQPQPAVARATKDEGLIFCILKCLGLAEVERLCSVQRLFCKVLDGKVVPLLALYERNWSVVGRYLNSPAQCDGSLDSSRFEYDCDAICVDALDNQDFDGLRLLAGRGYDFRRRLQHHPPLVALARQALRSGCLARLSALRALDFDYSELLAEATAAGQLSEQLLLDRQVTVDLLGARLTYRCSSLELVGAVGGGYVEQQLARLCSSREDLFKAPFVVAAFMRAGASPAHLLRPGACGYLLLLALASESFNFVYLLVKEAVHLDAVFALYRPQLLELTLRALEHRRFLVLDLLHFCGFRLQSDVEEAQSGRFDRHLLDCLLSEDFAPVERLRRLGFSLRRLAERNATEFQAFVQSRLEAAARCGVAPVEQAASAPAAVAPPPAPRAAAAHAEPQASQAVVGADAANADKRQAATFCLLHLQRQAVPPAAPGPRLPGEVATMEARARRRAAAVLDSLETPETKEKQAAADLPAGAAAAMEEKEQPLWQRSASAALAPLRRLARLDKGSLQLHFRSRVFLEFADGLLAERAFLALRRIVEVHSSALEVYFAENRDRLEALALDAFRLRDMSLISNLASLAFPMQTFFARHQAEVDAVLLGNWLASKCWTELGALRGEARYWSFPAFFARNQERSDDLVAGIVENGYWFDLHNLAQLPFDFPAFFERRFAQVSAAVLGFITAAKPHFVLLRELSALNFPWPRFMEAHYHRIAQSKDREFLDFVISLDGYEVGSKVYGVVEQTCKLYNSMASHYVHMVPGDVRRRPPRPPPMPPGDCGGGSRADLLCAGATGGSASSSCPPSAALLAESQRQRSALPGSLSGCSTVAAASSSCSVADAATSSDSASGGPDGQPKRPRRGTYAEAILSRMAQGHGAGGESRSASASASAAGGSQADAAETARALRSRARDLAARARERRLDTKKVLALLVCRGAYCWNPLKVDKEECQEPSTWADVESALGFLESMDEEASQAGSIYSHHLLPHHLHGLAGGAPTAAGAAAAAAAAAAVVGAAGVGAAFLGAGAAVGAAAAAAAAAGGGAAPGGIGWFGGGRFSSMSPPVHLPAPAGGMGAGSRGQLLFHLFCLAQRGEELRFAPRVELFWPGILEEALPRVSDADMIF